MNVEFRLDEKLFRAVLPYKDFWKSDGKISSAAFKGRTIEGEIEGVSVTRDGGRCLKEVLDFMKLNFKGNFISVLVSQCYEVNAHIEYLPEPDNEFHSEIHGCKGKKKLTDGQAKRLAKCANIEYLQK